MVPCGRSSRVGAPVVTRRVGQHDESGFVKARFALLRASLRRSRPFDPPLGEDVTEVLDYVPASFRVIRHSRPKFSCRVCESITQAPAPELRIRRDRASAGLLVHVLVAKSANHSPLYRQSEIYAREGVGLDAQPWPNCKPTTRRRRCWNPARARPRLDFCGPICATG
jgi:transposase